MTKKEIIEEVFNEAYKVLIEEYILRGNRLIKPIKPRHGNCCTCQDCGQYHDDCVCQHNRVLKLLRKAKRNLKRRLGA